MDKDELSLFFRRLIMITEIAAEKILANVGGKENVVGIMNCSTRLRLELKDYKKANINAIKEVEGVKGVMEIGCIQIILGSGNVDKITAEVEKLTGLKSEYIEVCDIMNNAPCEDDDKETEADGIFAKLAKIFKD